MIIHHLNVSVFINGAKKSCIASKIHFTAAKQCAPIKLCCLSDNLPSWRLERSARFRRSKLPARGVTQAACAEQQIPVFNNPPQRANTPANTQALFVQRTMEAQVASAGCRSGSGRWTALRAAGLLLVAAHATATAAAAHNAGMGASTEGLPTTGVCSSCSARNCADVTVETVFLLGPSRTCGVACHSHAHAHARAHAAEQQAATGPWRDLPSSTTSNDTISHPHAPITCNCVQAMAQRWRKVTRQVLQARQAPLCRHLTRESCGVPPGGAGGSLPHLRPPSGAIGSLSVSLQAG